VEISGKEKVVLFISSQLH